jgi:hypothetical protein
MIHLKDFNSYENISENLKYHIDNDLSILENVFRPGSDSFFSLLKEARDLYENGYVSFSDLDKELFETTDIGKFAEFEGKLVALDFPFENDAIKEEVEGINEKAKSKKSHPQLNHPTRSSGPKKYQVYVKNPKTGNIKKINFGDLKGGLTTKINNPAARKSFVARHKCSTKKDKMTAGFWSCRIPRYKNLYSGSYSGFW